jgi:Ca2+-binding RTX toxin-like protein
MLAATALPQPASVPPATAISAVVLTNPTLAVVPVFDVGAGSPPAVAPTEILFVDAAVTAADRLLLGLDPAVEVVTLASDRDGIDQITGELAQRQGITAVHLLGHGAAGRIQLGNGELSAETIQTQGDRLTDWANALTDDADLLIYGCDVASTDDGRTLLDILAGRTGADVAASDDLTGSAAQGGDWELEWRSGAIETDLPFAAAARDAYAHTLATFTVTTTQDELDITSEDGAGISLREAIRDAGLTAEADTILVPAGTYTLEQGGPLGTLSIQGSGAVTISGAGSSQTIIDGSNLDDSVMEVLGDTTLDGVMITGGSAAFGGGISSDDANLRIFNSALSGNKASSAGGGVYQNTGSLEIFNTIIDNNTAGAGGAGIEADGSQVTVQNSTLANNTGLGLAVSSSILTVTNSAIANQIGTGLFADNSTLTISNSTFANNSQDGVRAPDSTLTIANSTFANNQEDALDPTGMITLTNSTLANNGRGIFVGGGMAGLTINNTLFANTLDIEVVDGVAGVTGGDNLLRDSGGNAAAYFDPTTNLLGIDPQIGTLTNNGGLTQTIALLTGSPAIDAGNNSTAAGSTDQRGLARIAGTAVDIGAYEVQEIPPPTFGDIQVIDLDNGGVLIPDNSTEPVFVGIGEPGEIVERNLQIQNLGDGTLEIAQPVLPTGFSATAPLFPNVIQPGESLPLTFRLDTSRVGGQYGFFSFVNNDTDSNPYNFPLFGITFLPFSRYSLILERPPFPVPNLTPTTITATPSSRAVTGRQGDESLLGSDAAEVLIGFGGNDNLIGNGGDDNLYGLQGNDYLDGGDGDDNLTGGSGNDALRGGAGRDAIAGSSGNDRADGGLESDQINGDAGDDFLDGGDGDDVIDGGADNDALLGAAGNDAIAGGTGLDSIVGEAGDDVLDGGDDDDILSGDAGNDVVLGGNGLDTVIGGDGDDVLDGGAGSDILQGDGGSDRFVLAPVPGTKFIVDFTAGEDLFQLEGGLTFADLTITRNNLGQTEIRFSGQILAILQRPVALTASNFVESLD